jgi:hypothetical protein
VNRNTFQAAVAMAAVVLLILMERILNLKNPESLLDTIKTIKRSIKPNLILWKVNVFTVTNIPDQKFVTQPQETNHSVFQTIPCIWILNFRMA